MLTSITFTETYLDYSASPGVTHLSVVDLDTQHIKLDFLLRSVGNRSAVWARVVRPKYDAPILRLTHNDNFSVLLSSEREFLSIGDK